MQGHRINVASDVFLFRDDSIDGRSASKRLGTRACHLRASEKLRVATRVGATDRAKRVVDAADDEQLLRVSRELSDLTPRSRHARVCSQTGHRECARGRWPEPLRIRAASDG